MSEDSCVPNELLVGAAGGDQVSAVPVAVDENGNPIMKPMTPEDVPEADQIWGLEKVEPAPVSRIKSNENVEPVTRISEDLGVPVEDEDGQKSSTKLVDFTDEVSSNVQIFKLNLGDSTEENNITAQTKNVDLDPVSIHELPNDNEEERQPAIKSESNDNLEGEIETFADDTFSSLAEDEDGENSSTKFVHFRDEVPSNVQIFELHLDDSTVDQNQDTKIDQTDDEHFQETIVLVENVSQTDSFTSSQASTGSLLKGSDSSAKEMEKPVPESLHYPSWENVEENDNIVTNDEDHPAKEPFELDEPSPPPEFLDTEETESDYPSLGNVEESNNITGITVESQTESEDLGPVSVHEPRNDNVERQSSAKIATSDNLELEGGNKTFADETANDNTPKSPAEDEDDEKSSTKAVHFRDEVTSNVQIFELNLDDSQGDSNVDQNQNTEIDKTDDEHIQETIILAENVSQTDSFTSSQASTGSLIKGSNSSAEEMEKSAPESLHYPSWENVEESINITAITVESQTENEDLGPVSVHEPPNDNVERQSAIKIASNDNLELEGEIETFANKTANDNISNSPAEDEDGEKSSSKVVHFRDEVPSNVQIFELNLDDSQGNSTVDQNQDTKIDKTDDEHVQETIVLVENVGQSESFTSSQASTGSLLKGSDSSAEEMEKAVPESLHYPSWENVEEINNLTTITVESQTENVDLDPVSIHEPPNDNVVESEPRTPQDAPEEEIWEMEKVGSAPVSRIRSNENVEPVTRISSNENMNLDPESVHEHPNDNIEPQPATKIASKDNLKEEIGTLADDTAIDSTFNSPGEDEDGQSSSTKVVHFRDEDPSNVQIFELNLDDSQGDSNVDQNQNTKIDKNDDEHTQETIILVENVGQTDSFTSSQASTGSLLKGSDSSAEEMEKSAPESLHYPSWENVEENDNIVTNDGDHPTQEPEIIFETDIPSPPPEFLDTETESDCPWLPDRVESLTKVIAEKEKRDAAATPKAVKKDNSLPDINANVQKVDKKGTNPKRQSNPSQTEGAVDDNEWCPCAKMCTIM